MDHCTVVKTCLILLAVNAQLVSAVTHSLKYFYTAVTPGIDFPEFTVVGLVDGEQHMYYDSNTKRLVPRTDWMEKITADDPDYWNRESEKALGSQGTFNASIDILMERFNQTRGVHTVQVMYGCELDDDGTKRGYRQEGYDGEDFISLDLNTLTWTAANAKAVITKQKLDRLNAGGYHKSYLENTCIEWLQKYVGYGRSTLERRVRPEVTLFQKDSSSPVVCHATGFYPKPVMISWKKNGENLYEGVEIRETLPNQDGTFQKRSVLTVPPEELKNNEYTCVVQHSSLEKELRLSDPTVLTGRGRHGLIIALVLVLLICGAGVVMMKMMKMKKCGKGGVVSGSGSSQLSRDGLHPNRLGYSPGTSRELSVDCRMEAM